MIKTALLLILIGTSACSTLKKNSGIDIELYPVDSLDKNEIFAFTKKNEYEREEDEFAKNNLIMSCSRSFSKSGFKIFNKIVKDDDVVKILTKGVVIIKTHQETIETDPGIYKKTLYLTFEKFNSKNRRIESIFGVKAIKTSTDPLSSKIVEDLCDAAVDNLN